jgi:hypothetical protein
MYYSLHKYSFAYVGHITFFPNLISFASENEQRNTDFKGAVNVSF